MTGLFKCLRKGLEVETYTNTSGRGCTPAKFCNNSDKVGNLVFNTCVNIETEIVIPIPGDKACIDTGPDIPWLIQAKKTVKIIVCPTAKCKVVVSAEPYPGFWRDCQAGCHLKFIIGRKTGIAAEFYKSV